MKLNDVQNDNVRARLRASNLDDLENAFKDESPLSESYDETSEDTTPYTASQASFSSQTRDYDSSLMQESNDQDGDETAQSYMEMGSSSVMVETVAEESEEDSSEELESQVDSFAEQQQKAADLLNRVDTEIENQKQREADALKKIEEQQQEQKQKQREVDVLKKVEEQKEVDLLGPVVEETLIDLTDYSEKNPETKLEESIKPAVPAPIVPERSVQFQIAHNKNSDNSDDPEQGSYNSFPFSEQKQNNDTTQLFTENDPFSGSGYQRPTKQASRPSLVINGYEYFTPHRKTILATILLLLAVGGFTLSMTTARGLPAITGSTGTDQVDPCADTAPTPAGARASVLPPTSSDVKCVETTISPAPSTSQNPTLVPSISSQPSAAPTVPVIPNIYDLTYSKVQKFIVESQISNHTALPDKCNHPLCVGGFDKETITLEQKTTNYLFTNDRIFAQWLYDDELLEHSEKVIERYILTLMAHGLDSGGWNSNANWPIANNFVKPTDVCDWVGITCEERSAYVQLKDFVDHTVLARGAISGREVEVVPMVTKIVLRDNSLIGQLPQEMFKLRHLEELKLHHNKFSGTLPASIGLLSNMKKLWIHDTGNISGTIPAAIGGMTSLTSLWLGVNKLEGSIPKEIEKLTNLETLALLNNELKGTVPDEILKLTKLKNLYLDINHLNGTLPELGQLRELRDLRLDTNHFYGTLPYSLSRLDKLETFYAYKNELEGNLVDSLVVGLRALVKLELFDNKLTGTISSYFGGLPNLVTLDLHNNRFDSTITAGLCNQKKLKKLDLGSNDKIRGKIPDFSTCVSLETLDLSFNSMTGTIPAFLKDIDLRFLSLKGNNFTGIAPPDLCEKIPSCNT